MNQGMVETAARLAGTGPVTAEQEFMDDMLFDLENDTGDIFPNKHAACEHNMADGSAPRKLQAFCKLIEPLQPLAEAVHEARATLSKYKSLSEVHLVAGELRNSYGYNVRLRTTSASNTSSGYLRHLKHTFIVVSMVPGIEGTTVIVDMDFPSHFRLSRATPQYDALLSSLPEHFIGTVDTLAVVISFMADGIRHCFAQLQKPLPPWRSSTALISKWLPDHYTDVAVPKQPRSALYIPPGSIPSVRSGNSTARLADSRRASASTISAVNAKKFPPAMVVRGFHVAPAWRGTEARAGGGVAAIGAAAVRQEEGAVGGMSGQLRVAANWEVLQRLLPPMRTVKLGAG